MFRNIVSQSKPLYKYRSFQLESMQKFLRNTLGSIFEKIITTVRIRDNCIAKLAHIRHEFPNNN